MNGSSDVNPGLNMRISYLRKLKENVFVGLSASRFVIGYKLDNIQLSRNNQQRSSAKHYIRRICTNDLLCSARDRMENKGVE